MVYLTAVKKQFFAFFWMPRENVHEVSTKCATNSPQASSSSWTFGQPCGLLRLTPSCVTQSSNRSQSFPQMPKPNNFSQCMARKQQFKFEILKSNWFGQNIDSPKLIDSIFPVETLASSTQTLIRCSMMRRYMFSST